MQRPTLIFENTPYFLILCVLGGLAYAYVLYRKKGPWSGSVKWLLFGLRAIAVAGIAALLISPILRQIINDTEEPILVIAVDNSLSIPAVTDSVKRGQLERSIESMAEQVQDNYRIEYRTLSGSTPGEMPSQIKYDAQSTDINNFLKEIKQDFEGRNLNGVVLISDGIYNQGISPTFSDFNFNIYTVGWGDTIPKPDLSIVSLLYNKISYQGNRFPLVAQVSNKNFKGQKATVSILKDGKLIDRQTVNFTVDNQVLEVKFLIEAEQSGYQRYQVKLEEKTGEFTYANNLKQAYVEVIKGKEQIALVAYAPHPDIKALKGAVESNQNYTIDQFILSNPEDIQKLAGSSKKYDLVVFHQIPDRRGMGKQFINKFKTSKSSSLFIFGPQTDLGTLNQVNDLLTIDAVPNEYDNVTGAFNQGFSSFKLSDQLQQSFEEFPPLQVPFGKIDLLANAEVLLFQQVGKIKTTKPLIAVKSDGDIKKGIVLTDGLWKWKLTDYAQHENNEAFNELITTLVQHLSSKEDKRKFKVYPVKNEFLTNEKVVFETEVYNDLYERIYGNKIDLTLTDAGGDRKSYSYVTNESNTRYDISGLPEGVYQFQASTLLRSERQSVKGEFLVKELQLEALNLTADFDLLRAVSSKSGGRFYTSDQLEELQQALSTREAQGILHSNEKYLPFIHIKWLFFILLLLLSAEWFIRKYSGSY